MHLDVLDKEPADKMPSSYFTQSSPDVTLYADFLPQPDKHPPDYKDEPHLQFQTRAIYCVIIN
jgi:hypothetical protein